MSEGISQAEVPMAPLGREISIVSDPSSAAWQRGEAIEAGVFIEVDYVQSAAELADEYAKYVPNTEFVVIERDEKIVGSTRLIFFDENTGFKTLDDIQQGRLEVFESSQEMLHTLDLTQTFEVGTLAADKETRSKPEDEGRVAMALYGAIYGEGQKHGCNMVLASFDADYFNRFKGIFGPGVIQLGPGTDYMGSPTIPALMDLPKLYEHLGSIPGMQEMITQFANEVVHD